MSSGWCVDGPLGSVCIVVVPSGDGTTTRVDGRRMDDAGTAAAPGEAADRQAEPPAPDGPEWDPLAHSDRGAVARSARTVRHVADGVFPVSAVATGRGLGPHPGRVAGCGGCPRRVGLVAALPRRDRDPGAPARGGGEKGGGDQAVGKSKGGFSTKLHLRGEGFGKPITWVLTGGQRQEATQVEPLMEQGAVARPGRGRPRLGRTGSPATRATPAARSAATCAAEGWDGDPPAVQRASARGAVRSGGVPHTQPRRAIDQPPQAVSGGRHPLRQTRRPLPCHRHPRRHSALAVSMQTDPNPPARHPEGTRPPTTGGKGEGGPS